MAKKPKPAKNRPAKQEGPLDAKTVLQNAELAEGIDRLPELWNKYGNTVLIVITLGLLAFTAYSYRAKTIQRERLVEAENLALGAERVRILSRGELVESFPVYAMPAEEFSRQRKEIYASTNAVLTDALQHAGSDNTAVKGALRNLADLHWYIATMPDRPEATTRPELSMSPKPEDLLKKSAAAFQELINRFPTDTVTVAQAHLGLGAVAEEQRKFDEADKHYQAVIAASQPSPPSVLVAIAKTRSAMLPRFAVPLRPELVAPAALPAAAQGASTRPLPAPPAPPASQPAGRP